MKETKIPRPLNSFMTFRLEKQREIVAACPGANHRDISKIISKWWRELTPVEKQVYIVKAEENKAKHKAEYPDYKYSPNRTGKNKKRSYKKHPENELVTKEFDCMQKLISLYHYGETFSPLNEQKPSTMLSLLEKKTVEHQELCTAVVPENDQTSMNLLDSPYFLNPDAFWSGYAPVDYAENQYNYFWDLYF